MQPSFHVHRADALALPLADRTAHCCVTSPPYYGLRDYRVQPTLWPAVSYAPMPGLPPVEVPETECALGLEPTAEAYIGHLVLAFREVRRALRDDGTLWLNIGDTYAGGGNGGGGAFAVDAVRGARMGVDKNKALRTGSRGVGRGVKPKDLLGIPWRLAFALQADGWYLRAENIWAKPNPMPESVRDRTTRAHEQVFLLAKGPRYFYDADAIRDAANGRTDNLSFRREGSKRGRVLVPGSRTATHRPDRADTEPHTAGRNARSVWWAPRKPKSRRARTLTHLRLRLIRERVATGYVWRIAPGGYSGNHYATFPVALPERCILAGTSARGCCPACGAPWVRRVDRSTTMMSGSGRSGNDIAGKGHPSMQVREDHDIRRGPTSFVRTTGWAPSCACDAGEPIPCTVMDPFSGRATTGVSAIRNGRSYVGVEINTADVEASLLRLEHVRNNPRGRERRRIAPLVDSAQLSPFDDL